MARVMAFGTFDGVHKGHEYFLKTAKSHGTELVVVIARDETIEIVKARAPVRSEKQRAKDVKALKIADKVVLGNKRDKLRIIERYKPDVICLGYDQQAFTSSLEEDLMRRNLTPTILRLGSFKPEIYKSSIIEPSYSPQP
ncbi:FAD synthase [Candidatus Woesearchaeota archaeon]|nr:FAD synthase [Candidatus Woesearchaeota archaeon]